MNKTKYLMAFAILITVIGANTAHAETAQDSHAARPEKAGKMEMHKPGVHGTVTAISGTTITISALKMPERVKDTPRPTTPPTPTTVTYTVDATSATVTKAGAVSSVSAITVGDMLDIKGTLTGTTIVATKIESGMKKDAPDFAKLPAGNGQPIIGGSITAVSGTTLTVTNQAGATYAVDASAAKVSKKGTDNATISNVSVGDTVVIQGVVNGTNVTATTIMDSGTKPTPPTNAIKNEGRGFFGKIGGFFGRMFGF